MAVCTGYVLIIAFLNEQSDISLTELCGMHFLIIANVTVKVTLRGGAKCMTWNGLRKHNTSETC